MADSDPSAELPHTRVDGGHGQPTVDAPARWSAAAAVPPAEPKRRWWSRRPAPAEHTAVDPDDWGSIPAVDPWAGMDTDPIDPLTQVPLPPTKIDPPRTVGEPPRTAVEPPRTAVEPPRTAVEPPRTTVEPPQPPGTAGAPSPAGAPSSAAAAASAAAFTPPQPAAASAAVPEQAPKVSWWDRLARQREPIEREVRERAAKQGEALQRAAQQQATKLRESMAKAAEAAPPLVSRVPVQPRPPAAPPPAAWSPPPSATKPAAWSPPPSAAPRTKLAAWFRPPSATPQTKPAAWSPPPSATPQTKPPAWSPRPSATPRPTAAPHGQGQRPAAPPPRRSRRRRPRRLLLFVLLLMIGIPLIYERFPAARQYPVSASLPDSFSDLSLRDDDASRRATDRLAAQLDADGADTGDVFAGVYGDGHGKRVTVFGVTGWRFTPGSDAQAEINRLAGDFGIDTVTSYETGVAGVHEYCATGRSDGAGVVVCAWADHGSLAAVLLTRRSQDESADLVGRLRAAVLTRG